MEEKNAIITAVEISNEDHGCLTMYVTLDYGGCCQNFGGFNLYSGNSPGKKNCAGIFIDSVLKVAGVTRVSQLPGKCVRVLGDNSKIKAIGHIINPIWFNPVKAFEED